MNILLAPDPLRPGQHRLRTAWRIAGQFGILLIFAIILSIPLVILALAGFPLGTNFLFMTSQAIGFVSITGSVLVARRLLDRRALRSLGLAPGKAVPDMLAGFVIGGVMMGMIFLVEWLAGWIAVSRPVGQGADTIAGLLVMLLIFIAVGWQEELWARGYLLRNLSEGLNTGWAIILSSIVFALSHLANPNVSVMAVLGLLLAGVFFAFAALRSKELWLPIGLHIGWNFFEGPVFGFAVSGLTIPNRLNHEIQPGRELLTGGAFGPEAGLILLPGLALGMGLVWLWTRRRINL